MDSQTRNKSALWAVAGVGLSVMAWKLARRLRMADLHGQVAFITGGTRGLGLALAEELARQGAQIAICARDEQEFPAVREALLPLGRDPFMIQTDVSDREQVSDAVNQVIARFGRIDILVNNAGVIIAGPALQQTIEDFQETMAINFWGAVYMTMTTLPHMIERHEGRIVNISSIGGIVSAPHLLPYSSAKFALEGFSEGLRAELAQEGVIVTTVAPGLMRTGSYLNATIKGNHEAEYTLFSLVDNLRVSSTSAQRAARTIIAAVRRGDAQILVTPQAVLLAKLHGLFPSTTMNLLAVANRVLPGPATRGVERQSGAASSTIITRSFLLNLGRKAAERYNQYTKVAERHREAHDGLATLNGGQTTPPL